MKCELVQTNQMNRDNKAEWEILQFLSGLPSGYYVYRELRIQPNPNERTKGILQRRPDFVVTSPEIGLVSIEVKDWNLDFNTYQWKNQESIVKTDYQGRRKEIENPVIQVERYLYAFRELLRSYRVFVTSVLAFPRLSRQDFFNKFTNIKIFQNPQTKFFLNMETTIFKEDLDEFITNPEKLIQAIVRRNHTFFTSTLDEMNRVNEYLLPTSFQIGDVTKRQKNNQRLKRISEEQQYWIFQTDRDANYLLDVAGSGKTNALISKAIHLVDQAEESPPKILITTYSKTLEKHIEHIFKDKIRGYDENPYQDAITVMSVQTLMEHVIEECYNISIKTYKANFAPNEYEAHLLNDIEEIFSEDPEKYKLFDEIFIDEVQDFTDFYLVFLTFLSKSNRFFLVGDLGQKIYEREYDLKRIGILPKKVELPKTFKMYRTPKYISELATKFLFHDRRLQKIFEENGYTKTFLFPNTMENAAILLKVHPTASEIIEKIQSLTAAQYSYEDILVIVSPEKKQAIKSMLGKKLLPYNEGNLEESSITLVDFMNVKGLEREVVIMYGIEDLYHSGISGNLFASAEARYKKDSLSRRLMYVGLTRALEQLIIFYHDRQHPYISELITINKEIDNKRKSGDV